MVEDVKVEQSFGFDPDFARECLIRGKVIRAVEAGDETVTLPTADLLEYLNDIYAAASQPTRASGEMREKIALDLIAAEYRKAGMVPQMWFTNGTDPAFFRGSDYFLFKAILAALPKAPVAGDGERFEGYSLNQNGTLVAQAFGDRDTALKEIQHYAMMYGQDGPVEIFEIIHRPLPAPPALGEEV